MKINAEMYRAIIFVVGAVLFTANVLVGLYVGREKLPELMAMVETLHAQRDLLTRKDIAVAEFMENKNALAKLPAHVIASADELPQAAEKLSALLLASGMADTSFVIRDREWTETDDGSEILKVNFQLTGTGDYKNATALLQSIYNEESEYFFVDRITFTASDSGEMVAMSADILALFAEVPHE